MLDLSWVEAFCITSNHLQMEKGGRFCDAEANPFVHTHTTFGQLTLKCPAPVQPAPCYGD